MRNVFLKIDQKLHRYDQIAGLRRLRSLRQMLSPGNDSCEPPTSRTESHYFFIKQKLNVTTSANVSHVREERPTQIENL